MEYEPPKSDYDDLIEESVNYEIKRDKTMRESIGCTCIENSNAYECAHWRHGVFDNEGDYTEIGDGEDYECICVCHIGDEWGDFEY